MSLTEVATVNAPFRFLLPKNPLTRCERSRWPALSPLSRHRPSDAPSHWSSPACRVHRPDLARAKPAEAFATARAGSTGSSGCRPWSQDRTQPAHPAAVAALEHVDDARDHTPVIDAPRSRLVLRKMRFDPRPSLVRQPELRSHHQCLLRERPRN